MYIHFHHNFLSLTKDKEKWGDKKPLTNIIYTMKPRKIEDFFRKPFTFDRVARICFTLLIVGFIAWALVSLSSYLIPFALAWLLAYLMLPLVHWLQTKAHIRPRWVAVVLVLLFSLGIVVGILALLIPSITNEISKGWGMLQKYDVGAYLLSLLPEELSSKSSLIAKGQELLGQININEFFSSVGDVFSKGWGLIESTFSAITGATVIFIFLFYLVAMLLDFDKVRKGFFEILPESIRPFMQELGTITGYYINAYFRGQALIALICTVILGVGFTIIGLPMGITLAIFIGVLNMIPYLQVLGYIPLVLLVGLQSLSTGDNFFLLLLAAVAVVSISDALQSFVLTPSIQGQSLGIHPVVIMLSLTVWGALLGFLGLLFALPLTMIIYTIYMKYVVGQPVDEEINKSEEIARAKREELLHRFTRDKKEDKK